MKTQKRRREWVYRCSAVLLALLLWQLLSALVGMELLFASPLTVLKSLGLIVISHDFLPTVGFSLFRIGLGFLAAFAAGLFFGVLAYRFRVAEILIRPYVVVFQSVPVASFIILCLIWLSYAKLTVVISFLIAFPPLYSNVLQGMKAAPADLREMASLYRVPRFRQYLYVHLPALRPFLISSCSVAVGMAWKAGTAAEVIGMVTGSVGEKLYESKLYFLTADLLAWTVVIVLVSLLCEKAVVFLLKAVFKGVEKL